MWECPDLVRLDDRDVLVISPQLDHGQTAGADRWEDVSLYAVGDLDVDAPTFSRHGDFRQVDAGPDFYAPQTLTDETGRTIMIGWMGMPDHDGQPTLAEKHPTVANGWVHCLTVPRELSLDGDQLVQWPVAELTALHGAAVTQAGLTIEPGTAPDVLDGVAGPALDLDLTAEVSPGASVQVRLREGSGRPVVVTLDPTTGTATLDRTLLGTGEGGVTDRVVPGRSTDPRPDPARPLVDRGVRRRRAAGHDRPDLPRPRRHRREHPRDRRSSARGPHLSPDGQGLSGPRVILGR